MQKKRESNFFVFGRHFKQRMHMDICNELKFNCFFNCQNIIFIVSLKYINTITVAVAVAQHSTRKLRANTI